MKRILNFIKTKIFMVALAFIFPLTATALSVSLLDFTNAKADTNTTTYHTSYSKEKTMTNNNFNSSSSNFSINTSLSGWSKQLQDKKTTAGIISVDDNTFSQYKDNTYYLSKNPGKDTTSADYKILMINSKTSKDSTHLTSRQGYKSSTITLDANSYYSFQVSFKSDTNYDSYNAYSYVDVVSESTKTLPKDNFATKPFSTDDTKVYVRFPYKDNSNTYIEKKLTSYGTISADRILVDDDFYYTSVNNADDAYVGIYDDDTAKTPIFVKKSDIDSNNQILAGAEKFVCDLVFNGTDYSVPENTKYYKQVTEYSSLNDYTYGSIYLSGLKDEDNNDVKTEFVQVSSQDWQTFTFYVATGNKSQSVTLDLWLGTNESNHNSSGVVFFDNCHVTQHSENSFWDSYKTNKDNSYTQQYSISGLIQESTTKTTKLTNLTNDETINYSSLNFDFEDGIFNNNDDAQPVSKWSKTGNGNAQVFSTSDKSYFKSQTGYDAVGSDLSCNVDLDGTMTIQENKFLLGLWAENQSVKVTSGDIQIDSNTIYKITANYKVSELTSGSAYMLVSENDNVLSAYNLTSASYTLAAETSSGALSSNGSSEFNNKYNKVEFYVKGGPHFASSINISLSLGKDSETATGCVVFDNITIERASSTDYTNSSNKLALGSVSGTPSVGNGNFNDVTITKDSGAPYTPASWTNDKQSNKISFFGVINTCSSEYEKYVALYNQNKENGVSDENNPYYWAYAHVSPKNSESTNSSDNVLMVANVSNTWQNFTSPNISLGANETSSIKFKYNTAERINITITDSNNITLFNAKNITSGGVWKDYVIYFKTSNATTITLKIDFGTSEEKISGFAYFDNFTYKTIDSSVVEGKTNDNTDLYGVVDTTNMYQNLQTNKIDENANIENAVAYTGTLSTGDAESNIGAVVKSSKFDESETFKIDEDTNVFYFNNQSVGSYVIESKFPINLAEGYHTLTFKVKTKFVKDASALDSSKTYNYGLTIGLKNFDYLTKVRCDEDYETYTIFVHTTESTDTNLYLSFVSDDPFTCGTAVVYDVEIKSSTEDEYKEAKTKVSADGYDVNEGKTFVATASESSDEDDSESSDESENTNNNSLSDLDWSLIISGGITGLAIIIAIIFTILRKVKIGKIEKKRKEEYDRSSSLELTITKKKAEKQQAAELKEIQTNIDNFQKELSSIENEHKAKVVELRSQDKGKVSKETDREFKMFAKKRAAIAEKIDNLEKQKTEIGSADHLLELERKIFAKENAEKRNLEKESKKKNENK